MKAKNFILIGVLSLFIFSCAPAQEIQIVEAEERSISVTGVGEVKVAPDMAEVILGVYTSSTVFEDAQKRNEESTQKVLEALRKLSIDEKDIQVDYSNINTNYSYANNTQTIYQYEIKNNIKVTVHELRKLESIITEALKAGAKYISGIYFRIIEVETYQEEARKLAIQAAKEKAINMVSQLGQEIDEPLTIYEYQDSYAPTLYTFEYNDYSNNYDLNQINAVLFGQITIRVSVTIKFGLK